MQRFLSVCVKWQNPSPCFFVCAQCKPSSPLSRSTFRNFRSALSSTLHQTQTCLVWLSAVFARWRSWRHASLPGWYVNINNHEWFIYMNYISMSFLFLFDSFGIFLKYIFYFTDFVNNFVISSFCFVLWDINLYNLQVHLHWLCLKLLWCIFFLLIAQMFFIFSW